MKGAIYKRLGIGIFVIVAGIGALPLHRQVVAANEADPTTSVPVFGTTTVSQTFAAPSRLLTFIDIEISPSETLQTGTPLYVTLTDVAENKIVRQKETTINEIHQEKGFLHFAFKPLLTSPNNIYRVTLATPELKKDTALLIPFQIANELYPDGQYFIKDKPRPGDIGFRLGALVPLATTWPPYFTIYSKVWDVLVICILIFAGRSILRGKKTPDTVPSSSRKFTIRLLIFAAISTAVFWLAVWVGASGAFYDTAHDGLEAMEEVLMGNIQPFYEHYTGHQPLMDWILSILFLTIGINVWTLHSVGIAAGVVTTVLLVLVGRELWGERAGWYAGLLGFTSHWLIIIAQEGTRVSLIPPLMLIWLFGILKLRRQPARIHGLLWATLTGVGLGLLGYAYAAGWLLLPPLGIFTAIWCVYAFIKKRHPLATLLLFATMLAALMLLPLSRYLVEQPDRIFEHPKQITGGRGVVGLVKHTAANMPATVRGLTWLPVGPNTSWEDNGNIPVGPLSVPFPIPLLTPISGLVLIGVAGWTYWRLIHRKPVSHVGWLLIFAAVSLLPALIALGSQPSTRRSIGALVPLLLVGGWIADRLHAYFTAKQNPWMKGAGIIILIAAVCYGPIMYFGYAVKSTWFQTYYLRDLDILAPPTFARIEAGQRLAILGNWAHLKSFQYYALAMPQGKNTFVLLDPQPERWPLFDSFDAIVVVHKNCQEQAFVGFTAEPLVVNGQLGIVGCIFDKVGMPMPAVEADNDLPSSGPLLKEWWAGQGRFREHRPFRGPIFGRL